MVTKYNILIKTHSIDIHGNITTKWVKKKGRYGISLKFNQEDAKNYVEQYGKLGYGQYIRMEKCQD